MNLRYSFKFTYILLLFFAAALNLLGILVVRSACNMDPDIVTRQIIGSVAGFILCMVISFFDYTKLLKISFAAYIGICVMLAAVLVWGKVTNGAGRWITVPVLGQIQPAEFAKAGMIFCFAAFFRKYEGRLDEPASIFRALLLFGIPALLIFLEPNLSTTIIFFVIFVCMYIAAGLSLRMIAIFAGTAVVILGIFYFLFATGRYESIPFIQDYQKQRILSFLNPGEYSDTWLQQQNSILAIGSGGFFGKGLYNTDIESVKAGNFLIEEETDFIFAIIGEEMGFRGALGIFALFIALIAVILRIGARAGETAGSVICVGTAAWIGFQTFTNVAVATALFPNTGVTLPFFSRGVSSLIAVYIGLGLVLNVDLQTRQQGGK